MLTVDKNKLVYVDEAGFDNRDDYGYGYSPKGERCYGLKSGKRTERVSWIGSIPFMQKYESDRAAPAFASATRITKGRSLWVPLSDYYK